VADEERVDGDGLAVHADPGVVVVDRDPYGRERTVTGFLQRRGRTGPYGTSNATNTSAAAASALR